MVRGQHLQDLSAALAVTERMLGVAKDDDWQKLAELETSRRGLIQAAFSSPVPPADAALVADLIGRIQAANKDLVGFSSESRDRIAGALSTLAAGRRARSAYASASGRPQSD